MARVPGAVHGARVNARTNAVLSVMSEEDLTRLAPSMSRVRISGGQPLINAGDDSRLLIFPVDAILSIRRPSDRWSVELAVIGAEGCAGAVEALSDLHAPFSVFGAAPGEAYVCRLTNLFDGLRALLEKETHRQVELIAKNAAWRTHAKVSERLAMVLADRFERAPDASLRITHAELSDLLGVHRPGVTTALQILEERQAVRARRGNITLTNLSILLACANADANALGPASAHEGRA